MNLPTLRRVTSALCLTLGLLAGAGQLACEGPSGVLGERAHEPRPAEPLDDGERDASAFDAGRTMPGERDTDAGRRPTLSCSTDTDCTRFARYGLKRCHPFLDRCVACTRQSDCDDGEICELDGECERPFH